MRPVFNVPNLSFLIDKGDGDQTFFGTLKELVLVEESWFPDKIWRGKAYLFIIKNGSFKGRYVALTSRVLSSIPDQIDTNGVASVIVHLLPIEIDENFDFSSYNHAIGMSVIYTSKKWFQYYGSIEARLEK